MKNFSTLNSDPEIERYIVQYYTKNIPFDEISEPKAEDTVGDFKMH